MAWAASWLRMPSERDSFGSCTRDMIVDRTMPTRPWRISGRATVATPPNTSRGRLFRASRCAAAGAHAVVVRVLALAQDLNRPGEVAAEEQGVEGQVEVAVDDEVHRCRGDPFGVRS